MPKLILASGTQLELDTIFSIDIDDEIQMITIFGWKEGLNQTLDEFDFAQIKRIEFEGNHD